MAFSTPFTPASYASNQYNQQLLKPGLGLCSLPIPGNNHPARGLDDSQEHRLRSGDVSYSP